MPPRHDTLKVPGGRAECSLCSFNVTDILTPGGCAAERGSKTHGNEAKLNYLFGDLKFIFNIPGASKSGVLVF